eukprot:9996696-Alexandrium_andersonii.AAC.1
MSSTMHANTCSGRDKMVGDGVDVEPQLKKLEMLADEVSAVLMAHAAVPSTSQNRMQAARVWQKMIEAGALPDAACKAALAKLPEDFVPRPASAASPATP